MREVKFSVHKLNNKILQIIYNDRAPVRWPITVTAKANQSRQEPTAHGKSKSLTADLLLPWVNWLLPWAIAFAVSEFAFAVSDCFCREWFAFAVSDCFWREWICFWREFPFGVSDLLLPWAICFCRELWVKATEQRRDSKILRTNDPLFLFFCYLSTEI